MVAKYGLPQKAVPLVKAVPQPVAKAPKEDALKAKSDRRLFVRFGSDHPWHKLSHSRARVEIHVELQEMFSETRSFHRFRTGYAILKKDNIIRQRVLDAAPKLANINAKLEESSDLVASQIANVTAIIKTVNGTNIFNAAWVPAEIHSKVRRKPFQVRPQGTCRPRALYRSWYAIFARDSAPRASFHNFDESVIARKHQPHRKFQQFYRCLDFLATHGRSRAPVCLNCGSTLYPEAEYKATTKCHNCGSPHRTDSRDSLARSTRSGPIIWEELGSIRQASQQEFAKVARAKAARRKAEAGSQSSRKIR